MVPVTNTELLIIMTVAACIHLGVLGLVAYWAYDSRRMMVESRRMETVLGTLVIQEAEKIRRLVARAEHSS